MESIRDRIKYQVKKDRAAEIERQQEHLRAQKAAKMAKFATVLAQNKDTLECIKAIMKTEPTVKVEHLKPAGVISFLKRRTFTDSEYLVGKVAGEGTLYELARTTGGWIISDGLLNDNAASQSHETNYFDLLLTDEGRFFKKSTGRQNSQNYFYRPYGSDESTVGVFNSPGIDIESVFPTQVDEERLLYGFFGTKSAYAFWNEDTMNIAQQSHAALTARIKNYKV